MMIRSTLAICGLLLAVVALNAGERKSEMNVAYGDHRKQKVDIYWNSDFTKAPIVVSIHGGGWRNGDKKAFGSEYYQKLFVDELGCVLISPNYRLTGDFVEKGTSPTGKVDGMISDVASAIAYVQKHAAKYGADPGRVIVCGSSAGGHLSAVLAYCDERDWLEGTKYAGGKLNIIGWFGDSAPLSKEHNRQIPFNDDGIPIKNVDKDDPPAFMVVGTADRIVPPANSVDFDKVLKEKGISSEIFTVEGGPHVVGKRVVAKSEMQDALIRFVESVLKTNSN